MLKAVVPCRNVSFLTRPARQPTLIQPCLAHASRTRAELLRAQLCVNPCVKNRIRRTTHVVCASDDVQSTQIDDSVRQQVENAIQALNYRVTVGDVAARAGVKISEADQALKAIAYDSLGNLEVSNEGSIVYVFPSDFRSKLAQRSLLLRLKYWYQQSEDTIDKVVKFTFGATLIASLVILTVAFVVLAASAKSSDNRRSSSSSSSAGGFRFLSDLIDLLFRGEMLRNRDELNFGEAVYSWVFGDGDPNKEFEERRWRALGLYIQAKGGVVTAEEIAPFMDELPNTQPDEDSTYTEERYVLPALLKFEGEPRVAEDGSLLYEFPSLQTTLRGGNGAPTVSLSYPAKPVYEEEYTQTSASGINLFLALLFGALNAGGIYVLSEILTDSAASAVLQENGVGWIVAVFPLLQVYAATFFAVPAVRLITNSIKNAAIRARNALRAQAADFLRNITPNTKVGKKIAAARAVGKRSVIKSSDIVYDTRTDSDAKRNESDADAWIRKLEERA